MDLLDRYLHAVGFWLPAAQKQDIIAELSEDLRSQIEVQENGLGRPLTEAEVAAVLRRVGRPVLVANRYLPQRHLVGPLLFPVYLLVLKIVAACYLVPWTLVWVGLMMFDPAYAAAQAGSGWIGALGRASGSFWLTAVVSFAGVTAVFALLERLQSTSGFLEQWDPARLPVVRDRERIPRGASTVEIAANGVFTLWWTTVMWSPVVLDRPDLRIVLTPVWRLFFVAFLLLALVNMAAAGFNLLRPSWTRPRASVRLATNLASSALFCALCRSAIVAELRMAGVAAATAGRIATTINVMMARAFPVVLVVGVVILVVDVHRIVRLGVADPRSGGRLAQRAMPTPAPR